MWCRSRRKQHRHPSSISREPAVWACTLERSRASTPLTCHAPQQKTLTRPRDIKNWIASQMSLLCDRQLNRNAIHRWSSHYTSARCHCYGSVPLFWLGGTVWLGVTACSGSVPLLGSGHCYGSVPLPLMARWHCLAQCHSMLWLGATALIWFGGTVWLGATACSGLVHHCFGSVPLL